MNTFIPPVEELSQRLKALKGGELQQLASKSGVPASTLWKIRIGVTPNPGIETVRKFYPLLPEAPVTEQPAA
jgi:transcriptional regulator with XRE-family HTH domain